MHDGQIAEHPPMSVEEFEEYIFLPENRERRLEYVGGRVNELLPNFRSSVIGAHLGYLIGTETRPKKLGFITGGSVLPDFEVKVSEIFKV